MSDTPHQKARVIHQSLHLVKAIKQRERELGLE